MSKLASPMQPMLTTNLSPSGNKNNLPSGLEPQKAIPGLGQLETGFDLLKKVSGGTGSELDCCLMDKLIPGEPSNNSGSVGGKSTPFASVMKDKLSS